MSILNHFGSITPTADQLNALQQLELFLNNDTDIFILQGYAGTGKNGEWKKQDIIVETDGQYPKKVCISIWGDKINEQQLIIGNSLTIDFEIESREFSGRWYTDLKAWRVDSTVSNSQSQNNLGNISPLDLNDNPDDVLPF